MSLRIPFCSSDGYLTNTSLMRKPEALEKGDGIAKEDEVLEFTIIQSRTQEESRTKRYWNSETSRVLVLARALIAEVEPN